MPRRLYSLLFATLYLLSAAASYANSSEEKEGGEGAGNGTGEYIDLKPALITNYGGPGPIHFIKAEITLRAGKNPDETVKVSHHLPHIRHELVMLFSRQTEEGVSTMEGKEQLRKDALAAVQNVLKEEEGKPIVEDLLFNNFIIQR